MLNLVQEQSFGKRSFRLAGTAAWNSLPSLYNTTDTVVFKRKF